MRKRFKQMQSTWADDGTVQSEEEEEEDIDDEIGSQEEAEEEVEVEEDEEMIRLNRVEERLRQKVRGAVSARQLVSQRRGRTTE